MLNKYYDVTASRTGIENNRVDEATLFQVIKGVLADDIFKKTLEYGIGNWELVNGSLYVHYDCEGNDYTDEEAQERIQELEELIDNADEEEQEDEIAAWKADIQNLEDGVAYDIHQIYLVSEKAARILIEESDEIVFYNQELNAYVWCITFCGADWSEVLTSIPLNPERAA